ncbi:MAG: bacteriohemerythrin [Gammaproteobacteria bacterium]|jgi:hemerythrin
MSLIAWRPEYEIGIPDVDYEHRTLIDLINTTFEELKHGATAEAAELLLGEIHARIAAHFALEEKAMREMRYDEFDDHKADHERLLDEIRDLMDEVDDGLDADDLGRRLDLWFSEHFRTRDARLHRRRRG